MVIGRSSGLAITSFHVIYNFGTFFALDRNDPGSTTETVCGIKQNDY